MHGQNTSHLNGANKVQCIIKVKMRAIALRLDLSTNQPSSAEKSQFFSNKYSHAEYEATHQGPKSRWQWEGLC